MQWVVLPPLGAYGGEDGSYRTGLGAGLAGGGASRRLAGLLA
jgi:hypothetical protein